MSSTELLSSKSENGMFVMIKEAAFIVRLDGHLSSLDQNSDIVGRNMVYIFISLNKNVCNLEKMSPYPTPFIPPWFSIAPNVAMPTILVSCLEVAMT